MKKIYTILFSVTFQAEPTTWVARYQIALYSVNKLSLTIKSRHGEIGRHAAFREQRESISVRIRVAALLLIRYYGLVSLPYNISYRYIYSTYGVPI